MKHELFGIMYGLPLGKVICYVGFHVFLDSGKSREFRVFLGFRKHRKPREFRATCARRTR